MAKQKQKIKFSGAEFKPKRLANGLIGLRAPLSSAHSHETARVLDLQLSCDTALLILEPEVKFVQAQTMVSVKTPPWRWEAGEVVARALPLIPQDFEIE